MNDDDISHEESQDTDNLTDQVGLTSNDSFETSSNGKPLSGIFWSNNDGLPTNPLYFSSLFGRKRRKHGLA